MQHPLLSQLQPGQPQPVVPAFKKIGATYVCFIPFRPKDYPDELAIDLWEQYHRERKKEARAELKKQHNELVTKLNSLYGRKLYLLIH